MKERWLKMSLEEIPKISLEDAKHGFKKSLVVPVIEILEREIHTAVSLTKAVSVMLPVQECKRFLTVETWDTVLAEAVEIFRERGFVVDIIPGTMMFLDERINQSFSGGLIQTFGVSGWADALGEHAKLKP
jgi:hypothetical protein